MFSCFSDIHKTQNRNPALDSVRGLAALAVACGHFHIIWEEFARNGVWLFFVLSGYLLMNQAYSTPPNTLGHFSTYFIRRFFRIYPLYLLAITLFALFGNPNEADPYLWPRGEYFITRASFIYAEGFLWTVKQEVIFYALFPFIFLILLPLRRFSWLCASILVTLSLLTSLNFIAQLIEVTNRPGTNRTFFIAAFLMGMAAASLRAPLREIGENPKFADFFTIGTTTLMAALLIIPYAIDQKYTHATALYYMQLYTPLMAALILFLEAYPHGIIHRFFCFKPLRAIGIVSYSFYMWHWPVHRLLETFYPIMGQSAWLNLLATYCAAAITYGLIEKPGMRLGDKLGAWIKEKTNKPHNQQRA